VAFLE
ncbi:aconitase family protein, partial [Vibrio parahaemolyticus V-223/04]